MCVDVCALVKFLIQCCSGLLFGLSDADAKEAVSSTCRRVLLHAGKSYSGCQVLFKLHESITAKCSEAPPTARFTGDSRQLQLETRGHLVSLDTADRANRLRLHNSDSGQYNGAKQVAITANGAKPLPVSRLKHFRPITQ